jgi:hypothetical protein
MQVSLQAVAFLLSKVNCGILEDNSSNLPLGIEHYKPGFVVTSKRSRYLHSVSG